MESRQVAGSSPAPTMGVVIVRKWLTARSNSPRWLVLLAAVLLLVEVVKGW